MALPLYVTIGCVNSLWAGGATFVRQSPNLGITIFLYIAGILLVFMAIVLMLQAFGVVVPKPAIWAIVLLAIGSGILAGIRNR
jgi:hypothetical protein